MLTYYYTVRSRILGDIISSEEEDVIKAINNNMQSATSQQSSAPMYSPESFDIDDALLSQLRLDAATTMGVLIGETKGSKDGMLSSINELTLREPPFSEIAPVGSYIEVEEVDQDENSGDQATVFEFDSKEGFDDGTDTGGSLFILRIIFVY
jgi:hypothetical protein